MPFGIKMLKCPVQYSDNIAHLRKKQLKQNFPTGMINEILWLSPVHNEVTMTQCL